MDSILIVGASDGRTKSLAQALINQLPRVEVVELLETPEDLGKYQLVISLLESVDDYLSIARQSDIKSVPCVQVRTQDFHVDTGDLDDVWESPLIDQKSHLVLLDFPMLIVELFDEVVAEIAQAGTRELDDSSFFNVVTSDDVTRVIVAVSSQILAGSDNWGRYTYASGGKLTWHRLCAFLVELSAKGESAKLIAGAGLGIDRSLNGKPLWFDFAIKPRPWRVGVADLWRQYRQQ